MSLIFEDPQRYLEVTKEMQRQDDETLANTLEKIRSMTDEEWRSKLALLGGMLQDIRVTAGQTLRDFKQANVGVELSDISRAERGLALPSDDLIRHYTKSFKLIPKE